MYHFDHDHCPDGCEHPQAFNTEDNRRLCGRCFFVYNKETEVVPCTPEVCD